MLISSSNSSQSTQQVASGQPATSNVPKLPEPIVHVEANGAVVLQSELFLAGAAPNRSPMVAISGYGIPLSKAAAEELRKSDEYMLVEPMNSRLAVEIVLDLEKGNGQLRLDSTFDEQPAEMWLNTRGFTKQFPSLNQDFKQFINAYLQPYLLATQGTSNIN